MFVIFFFVAKNYKSYVNNTYVSPKYKVTLSLEDGKEFSTNDSTLFFGSTKGYYFFSLTRTNQNIIIPASEINCVKMTRLRESL